MFLLKQIKKNYYLILIILLTIPSFFALFYPGFILTDDGNWMVIRFSAFYEALRSGQFPVRYLFRLNNSLGYPVANFLYPLFMYIGVPIHVLGLNFANTIKVIYGTSFLLSGIFSFLWLRKNFSNLSSLAGSLIYVYFPYHLFDLYKRGSVGELLAIAIVPFILWQIEKRNFFWLPIGIALLVLSHNTLALIFIPVVVGYMLVKGLKLKEILYSLVLGILASAFFWFPALYDKQFTVFDKTKVSNFSEYFINTDNFKLLGLITVIAIIVSLFYLKNKMVIYFLTITAIAFYLSISLSNFFWKTTFLWEFIQFPFRFLSVIIVSVSFLTAFQIDKIKRKFKYPLFIIYFLLIGIFSFQFIKPVYQNYPDSFYSTNQDSTTVKNEYMPKWAKNNSVPTEKVIVVGQKSSEPQNLKVSGKKISFNSNLNKESIVQINMFYFPGWQVKIDQKPASVMISDDGFIRIKVSEGTHLVEAIFSETNERLIADFISLLGIGIILFSLKRRLV